MATRDANALQETTRRVSVQTFAKLVAAWNKQNCSNLVADAIKDAIGTYLVTPGNTQ